MQRHNNILSPALFETCYSVNPEASRLKDDKVSYGQDTHTPTPSDARLQKIKINLYPLFFCKFHEVRTLESARLFFRGFLCLD